MWYRRKYENLEIRWFKNLGVDNLSKCCWSIEWTIVFVKMWATGELSKCSFSQVMMVRNQLKGNVERWEMGIWKHKVYLTLSGNIIKTNDARSCCHHLRSLLIICLCIMGSRFKILWEDSILVGSRVLALKQGQEGRSSQMGGGVLVAKNAHTVGDFPN